MTKFANRWLGKTVVCIASGPSLTVDDCERVRASGHVSIVTNTTFRIAPWAHVLMAHDEAWWAAYAKEVDSVFVGERVTCASRGMAYGARPLRLEPGFRGFANSGAAAVSLAVFAGAARVIMLGYDCKYGADGAAHWHEKHPSPLGNAKSIKAWPAKFKALAQYARGRRCEVLNATRDTALACFPLISLEKALAR